jgi:hypothetical protein
MAGTMGVYMSRIEALEVLVTGRACQGPLPGRLAVLEQHSGLCGTMVITSGLGTL